MKKLLFAFSLLISIGSAKAQVKFDALQVTPQQPKALQTVNFKFNSKLSSLIDEKKVDIVVYLFNNKGFKVLEPKILQTGTVYSGNFKLDSNTACIAFRFSVNDNKEKDINANNGYFVPVYNSKNEPVNEYYTTIYNIQRLYGEAYFGITFNSEKAFTIFQDGIKKYPKLKNDPEFLLAYLWALKNAKKLEAIPGLLDELDILESQGRLTEADYSVLVRWYNQDKRKAKADSIDTAMKVAYPTGNWVKNEAGSNFNKEKDVTKKLALYNEYIAKYPPTESNKAVIDNFKSQMANAYASAKDYKAYNDWNNNLSPAAKASNNNNISWRMAEKDENLEEAKSMSYSATNFAKAEMQKPSEKKPDYLTTKQWIGQRKYQYAMYADTYAFIMYKTGDYITGYQYAKEAAEINEFKNAEYNERYTQLMVKVIAPEQAKKEIEKFVKDGVASSKTKDQLKELYVAEKKIRCRF